MYSYMMEHDNAEGVPPYDEAQQQWGPEGEVLSLFSCH